MSAYRAIVLAIGSPAWAGIDLIGVDMITDTIRFPRVGGDRP